MIVTLFSGFCRTKLLTDPRKVHIKGRKGNDALKRSLTMENFTITHGATDYDIRVAFDLSPNLTIAELARRSGKTVSEVKKILMGDYV